MIKTFKEEKKYLLILLGLVCLITLMCYLPSLINGVPVTFGTDIKTQWFEFYTEFKNLIRNFITKGEFPFYSWNMFLGNNFWASKAYYLIGDIYSYIGLLYNTNFFDMARDLTFLKFLVSAFGFYFYLTEIGRKPLSKVICSLAYTFSGWAIFYSGQLVFLSFYSMIPYYLWGIEKCLKGKAPWLFVLSCAFMFSCNFYFFYTITLISPLYYIYRYILLDLDWKNFFIRVIKQIGYYILGIGITAVFWLPGVIYILGSSRYRSIESFSLIVYLNYLFSSFVPNYLYIYRVNVFETPGAHYTREICMWASTCLLLLVPQFSKIFDKKEKKLTIIAYVIFVVIAFIPELDSAMHGFGDPSFRWVLLVVIFNMLVVSKILDNIDLINKKVLLITVISYIVIMLGLFFIALAIKEGTINEYLKQFIIILIFIGVIIIGYFLIINKQTKLILSLVVLELGLSGMYCYFDDVKTKPDDTYEYFENVTSIFEYYPGELLETIKSLDEENDGEFIRLYIPLKSVYWDFSQNLSLNYGIKGLLTYDSTYANSFSKMVYLEPSVDPTGAGWIFNITDDNLMSFLNTKYALVTYEDELSDNWELVVDNYHYGFRIYENKNYRKLGTTYSKLISEEEYKEKRDTSLFLDYVIVNENADIISSYLSDANGYIENVNNYGNLLFADYISDKDGFMIMTIPYDEGWSLYVDGEEIEYYNVSGGFIGFPIKEGTHSIEMSFIPKGFKAGLIISGVASIIFISAFIYIMKKNKGKKNEQAI